MKTEKAPSYYFNRVVPSIIAILMMFGLSSCMLIPREDELPAPPILESKEVSYITYEVNREDVFDSIHGYGMIVAIDQEDVKSGEIGGTLKKINVYVGDWVKKGDILAELYSDALENEIAAKRNELKGAQLSYEIIKLDYEGLTKRQDLARETLKYAVEAGAKVEAEAQIMRITNQKDAKKIDLEAKAIEINRLNEDIAELEKHLKTTKLYSPIDGRVCYVTSIPNEEHVPAEQVMFTVMDVSRLVVQYKPQLQTELKRYKVGMKVPLTIKGKAYEGEITFVDNSSTPLEDNKLKDSIIIEVEDLPDDVVIGDNAEFNIIFECKENVVAIPRAAIRRYLGRTYVQLLEKGSKIEQDIELGLESDTNAEIISGLKEGDRIILK